MDMKTLIVDFRHFQLDRERQKAKLKKMSSFNVVRYQRGAQPELPDVVVRIHKGASVNFTNQNGEGFFLLYDTDITTFDNGEPGYNAEDDVNEPTLIVDLVIYRGEQTIRLEFPNLVEKRRFLAALEAFLQFS